MSVSKIVQDVIDTKDSEIFRLSHKCGERAIEIERLTKELAVAKAGLNEAIDLIKAAKAQFAPTTTNSIADDFLKRMEKNK
jgi:hypothetical protein